MINTKIFLFWLFCVQTISATGRYDNYKVIKYTTVTKSQARGLEMVHERNSKVIFLDRVSGPGQYTVIVPPNLYTLLNYITSALKIKEEILVQNFQEIIEKEKTASLNEEFGWDKYQPLENIYAWMEGLVDQYPNIVSIFNPGTTIEGRPILGVKISYKPNNPGIFIESNIHAREWITSATSTFLINELLTSDDLLVRTIAENINWWILPVANPDGFVYSHTNDRLWRKNRRPIGPIKNVDKVFKYLDVTVYGVDLNRNFDFHWRDSGSGRTFLTLTDTYSGSEPFSEPESKSLAEFYTKVASNVTIYLAFHSYSQLLLYPYAADDAGEISNQEDHIKIGNLMVNKLRQRHGTQYNVSGVTESLYAAYGASTDWVKGVMNTPLVFTYEFRDTGNCGFVLPPDQIIPNSQEVLDSIIVLIGKAKKLGYF